MSEFTRVLTVAFVAACGGPDDTGGRSSGPDGPDPQTWVARPAPLPSAEPYITDLLTPGCTDGALRFDVWLAGWGGEVSASVTSGGAAETVALESVEIKPDTERWAATVHPGPGTVLTCDGAASMTVHYEVLDLDYTVADCVVIGPGASGFPGCADAGAW